MPLGGAGPAAAMRGLFSKDKVRTYTAAALASGGVVRAFAVLLAATARCS